MPAQNGIDPSVALQELCLRNAAVGGKGCVHSKERVPLGFEEVLAE